MSQPLIVAFLGLGKANVPRHFAGHLVAYDTQQSKCKNRHNIEKIVAKRGALLTPAQTEAGERVLLEGRYVFKEGVEALRLWPS